MLLLPMSKQKEPDITRARLFSIIYNLRNLPNQRKSAI